ncbi:carbohydrate-binding protein with CBM35 doain [Streptomyces puniciscabiei]|uniref:Carbohydrate-binding protein with CBM35 doain n=1 Tax=Streptomyces puniciscabiei TaxID=164348 RepID=A0A542UGI6_9ACTN|nr:CBM35 domain-containing protein [Streptomyces puniciscabiei]TQK98182.1 carbohydrate-binding protein with CBM35 doain [Streptomyces puniciscabiei]
MTPGENGPSTPEDDDPFGYLYADGQARGAQPPSGGYGYPNSVSRVRAVGERQYGQQQAGYGQQQATYGQQPGVPQQPGAYGQPNAHYQAPETLPGGAPTTRQPAHPAPGRRGPNTKGLLIGAIAVVAAVVIGIGVAMLNDNSDDKTNNQAGTTPTQSQSQSSSPSSSNSAAPGELPKTDASALQLGPGVTTASSIKGSKAKGGSYVTGFNHVGATVTWTVNDVQEAGSYRLYVRYGIPGVDANATLVVNGKADSRPLNMKNFGNLPQGDWEKGWQTTWANVNLNQGTNTIQIACNDGNQCNAVLDQLYITK